MSKYEDALRDQEKEYWEKHKVVNWDEVRKRYDEAQKKKAAGSIGTGTIGVGNETPTPMPRTTSSIIIPPKVQALDLRTELQKRLVGQDHVLDDIVSAFYRWETGFAPENAPAGSFLFLGPTGTGKTRTVESLAEAVLGSEKALLKVDCAEFAHSHEIAKLLGSPPGYLGHRETHAVLTSANLNKYATEQYKCSFLLFDEIEKASDALWNLLLGLLDKAVLTLGDNSKTDFSNTFVFMTSNLGAREMQTEIDPVFGFRDEHALASQKKLDEIALQAARKKFTPEFMNRIDVKAVYRLLNKDSLELILDQLLERLQRRILKARLQDGFVIEVSADVRDLILREGISKAYGARELKRAVELHLVRPLIHQMRQDPDEWKGLTAVTVQLKDGQCVFRKRR